MDPPTGGEQKTTKELQLKKANQPHAEEDCNSELQASLHGYTNCVPRLTKKELFPLHCVSTGFLIPTNSLLFYSFSFLGSTARYAEPHFLYE